jgi:hypothetical protein
MTRNISANTLKIAEEKQEQILFRSTVNNSVGHVFLCNTDGTALRQLTTGTSGCAHPQANPEGNRITYSKQQATNIHRIFHINIDSTGEEILFTPGSSNHIYPCYSLDGSAVTFASTSAGSTTNFEIVTGSANGTGTATLTNLATSNYAPFFISGNTQIAFVGDTAAVGSIYSYFGNSTSVRTIKNTGLDIFPASYSPTSNKILFHQPVSSVNQVWACNEIGGETVQLTSGSTASTYGYYSPNAEKIVFISGGTDMYVMRNDGRNPINISPTGGTDIWPKWINVPSTILLLDFKENTSNNLINKGPYSLVTSGNVDLVDGIYNYQSAHYTSGNVISTVSKPYLNIVSGQIDMVVNIDDNNYDGTFLWKDRQYALQHTSGYVVGSIFTTGGWQNLTTTGTIETNKYNRITYQFGQNNNHKILLNGVENVRYTITGNIARNGNSIYYGIKDESGVKSNPLIGGIDSVRILSVVQDERKIYHECNQRGTRKFIENNYVLPAIENLKYFSRFDVDGKDLSRHRNDMQFVSGATVSGKVCSFPRDNVSYSYVPSGTITGDKMTFGAWLKFKSINTTGSFPSNNIIAMAKPTESNHLTLWYDGTNNNYTLRKNPGTDYDFSNSAVEDNGWHFVAFSYSASGVTSGFVSTNNTTDITTIGFANNIGKTLSPNYIIFNQEIDFVSGSPLNPSGFAAEQSGCYDMKNLFLYDTNLSKNEILILKNYPLRF